MTITAASVYKRALGAGVTQHAHQFQSLVMCSQERLVYRVIRGLPQGSRCLDWGCGNGHLEFAMNGMNVKAFSLDGTTALTPMDRLATGSHHTRLPYPDSSFDVVLAVGVLEHVHERDGSQRGSLEELRRILRPGGEIHVFHLPNKWSWLEA